MLRVKRVYEPAGPEDGLRVLVDRLWPRGLAREVACVDRWEREVAPSDGLRRWFGHRPERWEEFRRRYFAELDARPEVWRPLLEEARRSTVTLLYSARSRDMNNAVALRDYLLGRLQGGEGA